MLRLVIARTEAALWRGIGQRLVRTLRVVVANPFVQRLLCCLEVAEHLPGVELDSKRLVKALDLPGRGRRAWLGQDVVDSVFATDAVEEHLDRRLGETPGEDLAVVGQDLCRDTMSTQSRCKPIADGLGSLTHHQPRRDAVSGMVV